MERKWVFIKIGTMLTARICHRYGKSKESDSIKIETKLMDKNNSFKKISMHQL